MGDPVSMMNYQPVDLSSGFPKSKLRLTKSGALDPFHRSPGASRRGWGRVDTAYCVSVGVRAP